MITSLKRSSALLSIRLIAGYILVAIKLGYDFSQRELTGNNRNGVFRKPD
jgi:hypothetical protein